MYRDVAPYYDLLHEELDDDIEFVAKLAEQTGDPILEVGCGTGRLTLPLARLGHKVVGVDASKEMLDIARGKLEAEDEAVQALITLEEGEFSEVRLHGQFRLAIIAYNTLMHLGPAAVAFCLGNISRHLEPGGALFIDVDNPTLVHDPGQDGLLLLDRVTYDAERDETVVLSVSSNGDGDRQIRETVWLIDASPAKGGPVKRTVAQATLHYYFAHQMVQILETAGFNLVAQYGNYQQQAYHGDVSPRLLTLASVR